VARPAACHSGASRGLRPVLEQLGATRLPGPEKAEVPVMGSRAGRGRNGAAAGRDRSDWEQAVEPLIRRKAHRPWRRWGPPPPPPERVE